MQPEPLAQIVGGGGGGGSRNGGRYSGASAAATPPAPPASARPGSGHCSWRGVGRRRWWWRWRWRWRWLWQWRWRWRWRWRLLRQREGRRRRRQRGRRRPRWHGTEAAIVGLAIRRCDGEDSGGAPSVGALYLCNHEACDDVPLLPPGPPREVLRTTQGRYRGRRRWLRRCAHIGGLDHV